MRINVASRHGHLAADTQDTIRSKAEKLERFHHRISNIQVTVDLEDDDSPGVEILVSVDGANDFVAQTQAHGGNLIGAVEGAVHKLEQQLRKYKEKVIDHHRNGSHKHQPLPEIEGDA